MNSGVETELVTCKEKVRRVIEKYKDRFEAIWENYTLVLLLVIREQGVFIPPDAIEAAARRELPNLTSIHRSLTLVKQLYQPPDQAARSDELEDDWRTVLGGDMEDTI